MTTPARFLQIHTLTSYPAVLLNRDDAGLAKRLPFGGAVRTRISSQCLKRHWRMADGEYSLGATGLELSVRSRETFQREIVDPVLAEGKNREVVEACVEALMKEIFQESAKAAKEKADSKVKKDKGKSKFNTAQVVVLGRAEVRYLRDLVSTILADVGDAKVADERMRETAKRHRANIRALRAGAGLDAAMFGRMVTSDILARTNAAVHVAHAFTVHAEESETDYFTAVDDLITGVEETGSGHLGETELSSGLYYGYVVVDLPTLIGNIEAVEPANWATADRTATDTAIRHLLHLIAKTSPGAKLGSTAPHSYAQFVLLETGSTQPRTLANAFQKPVLAGHEGMGVAAVIALRDHLQRLDSAYGIKEKRWQCSTLAVEPLPAAMVQPFDLIVSEAVAALGRQQ
jgi:CRISPR system Cascade subunit CasC